MDSNNLTKSGYITPVVDFLHLREVLVILDLKSTAGADSLENQQETETDMIVQTEGETAQTGEAQSESQQTETTASETAAVQ